MQKKIKRLVDEMDIAKLCKEILLMPIDCDKKYAKITRSCGVIQTGQRYYSTADEDMSDFSIHFYEVIYRDLLNDMRLSALLSNTGRLCSDQLAGDTMYSFNATARKTNGAEISGKGRTLECHRPEYLCDYFHKYHCLANFWLLPMKVGRTLRGQINKGRNPGKDYMDIFLETIQNNINFDESEGCYYSFFEDWDGFINKHFINAAYLSENKIDRYSDLDRERFIEVALKKIGKRAEDIAESKYATELVELFMNLGIV